MEGVNVPVYKDGRHHYMITKQGRHVLISHIDYDDIREANEAILKLSRKLNNNYTNQTVKL